MMRSQLLGTSIVTILGLALLSACNTSTRCSASNCSGCCDAAGQCQAGNTTLVCGALGGQCAACASTQTCVVGVCGTPGAGGGTGTTGGGMGTTGGGMGTTGGGVGTTGGGGGTNGELTYAQFCTEALTAQANLSEACGERSPQGIASLRAQIQTRCAEGLSPAFKDGRATFDSAAAAACLTELRASTCTTNPETNTNCAAVFPGAVGLNGSCFAIEDCTRGLYCDTTSTCPGRCAPRVALGQPLPAGAKCVEAGENYEGVCTALVALGESCSQTGTSLRTHGCVPGAICRAPAFLCVAITPTFPGPGQQCDGQCGLGLWCDGTTCAPLVTAGNSCERSCQADLICSRNQCSTGGVNTECYANTDCSSELFCEKGGGPLGNCKPRHTEGGPCTLSDGSCAATLLCSATTVSASGVCQRRAAVGEGCASDGECTTAYCSASGVCALRKGAGEPCLGSVECRSGACQAGACTVPANALCVDDTP